MCLPPYQIIALTIIIHWVFKVSAHPLPRKLIQWAYYSLKKNTSHVSQKKKTRPLLFSLIIVIIDLILDY